MRFLGMILLVLASFSSLKGQSITGTWTTFNQEIQQPVNMVFLENGNFRMRWGVQSQFEEPTYGWGAYSLEGNKLVLQFFTGEQHQYTVKNKTGNGMDIVWAQDGSVFACKYSGKPQLEVWEKTRIVSETNFFRLTGMWETEAETLKFLGDGLMFVHTPENNNSQWYFYTVTGNTLFLQELDKTGTEEYRFTAELKNFSAKGFSFSDANNTTNYKFIGSVELTNNETFLYKQFQAMHHRLNMNTIDAMDGVQDFIWKRVDASGNVID